LDQQQRALIQAQEKEMDALRARLNPGTTAIDRNATIASFTSTGSFNLDTLTAKNEERMRRLNASPVTTSANHTSQDILSSFLNDTASKGLSVTQPFAGVTGLGTSVAGLGGAPSLDLGLGEPRPLLADSMPTGGHNINDTWF